MDTVLNSNVNQKSKVLKVTLVIMALATVLSFGSFGYADNDKSEVASFRTMNTAVIKGSEHIKEISVKEFIGNIGKNTGIYKMIHTETPEEIAQAKAEAEPEDVQMEYIL